MTKYVISGFLLTTTVPVVQCQDSNCGTKVLDFEGNRSADPFKKQFRCFANLGMVTFPLLAGVTCHLHEPVMKKDLLRYDISAFSAWLLHKMVGVAHERTGAPVSSAATH
jgi:hypothetical protein